MSEITKLYENAGVKKINAHQSEIDNGDPRFTGISHSDSYIKYPQFTVEKQIEICKFLLKVEHSISYYFYENRYGFVVDDKQDDCIEAERFETALAMIVNNLWQDLTEEEKQQVKGILE